MTIIDKNISHSTNLKPKISAKNISTISLNNNLPSVKNNHFVKRGYLFSNFNLSL